jgi:hypothetical protein
MNKMIIRIHKDILGNNKKEIIIKASLAIMKMVEMNNALNQILKRRENVRAKRIRKKRNKKNLKRKRKSKKMRIFKIKMKKRMKL